MPRIVENLEAAPGETFEEVYRTLLSKVPTQYGSGDEQWTATKEVWSKEFVPALARTFTDSQFLLMVRDLRPKARDFSLYFGKTTNKPVLKSFSHIERSTAENWLQAFTFAWNQLI